MPAFPSFRKFFPDWDDMTEEEKKEIRYAVSQGWDPEENSYKEFTHDGGAIPAWCFNQ
jgi:hypothetical protein